VSSRQNRRQIAAVMAKQLPPSAARLRLLDLDGAVGADVAALRRDIEWEHITAAALLQGDLPSDCFDAIVGCDLDMSADFLAELLRLLRPGGRLIALELQAGLRSSRLQCLRGNGYVRILVEPALAGSAVLLRGEKAHTSADTRQRIDTVARADGDSMALRDFRGVYVHLLIQQQPNIPIWRRDPATPLSWRATALQCEDSVYLLAFSSLPKAVGFLQDAVLEGVLRDSLEVNKIGKFRRALALQWAQPLLLNPRLDALRAQSFCQVDIDPAQAEAPDE